MTITVRTPDLGDANVNAAAWALLDKAAELGVEVPWNQIKVLFFTGLEDYLKRAEIKPADNAPDWEGFGREVMGVWPTGDLDGGHLQELAVKHRVLVQIEGGFDPVKYVDPFGETEPGDDWFLHNYVI